MWKWRKQIAGLLPGWVSVEQMPQNATQVTKSEGAGNAVMEKIH